MLAPVPRNGSEIGTGFSRKPLSAGAHCCIARWLGVNSHGNITRHLVELLDCRRFPVSTNGSIHGHPDPQAIAQILKYGPAGTLYSNYRTIRTAPWDDERLKRRHDY